MDRLGGGHELNAHYAYTAGMNERMADSIAGDDP